MMLMMMIDNDMVKMMIVMIIKMMMIISMIMMVMMMFFFFLEWSCEAALARQCLNQHYHLDLCLVSDYSVWWVWDVLWCSCR
jgi:hypothetical protein